MDNYSIRFSCFRTVYSKVKNRFFKTPASTGYAGGRLPLFLIKNIGSQSREFPTKFHCFCHIFPSLFVLLVEHKKKQTGGRFL